MKKQQGNEEVHFEPGAFVVIGEKEEVAQNERPVLLGSTFTIKEGEQENKKDQVLEALGDWLIRVVDKKGLATPEEIAALPKVAEIFLKDYYSVFLPVKNKNTSSIK